MASPTTGQVSLLRGINVGGNALVPMARVRELYTAMGLADVRTHLQSGNVVFRSERSPDDISAEAEAVLKEEFGRAIRVLGRRHADLERIVGSDPFPDAQPNRHVVVFLSATPPAELMERLTALATRQERLHLAGHELHVDYGDGMVSSKVNPALLDRAGIVATARNWRTVSRVLEMTAPEG